MHIQKVHQRESKTRQAPPLNTRWHSLAKIRGDWCPQDQNHYRWYCLFWMNWNSVCNRCAVGLKKCLEAFLLLIFHKIFCFILDASVSHIHISWSGRKNWTKLLLRNNFVPLFIYASICILKEGLLDRSRWIRGHRRGRPPPRIWKIRYRYFIHGGIFYPSQ